MVPLKALPDQVCIEYRYSSFLKLIDLIMDTLQKWFGIWTISFKTSKTTKSSTLFIRYLGFKLGYHCESDFAIFEWRITWNYSYSLLIRWFVEKVATRKDWKT